MNQEYCLLVSYPPDLAYSDSRKRFVTHRGLETIFHSPGTCLVPAHAKAKVSWLSPDLFDTMFDFYPGNHMVLGLFHKGSSYPDWTIAMPINDIRAVVSNSGSRTALFFGPIHRPHLSTQPAVRLLDQNGKEIKSLTLSGLIEPAQLENVPRGISRFFWQGMFCPRANHHFSEDERFLVVQVSTARYCDYLEHPSPFLEIALFMENT
jgi:hypothetical protein